MRTLYTTDNSWHIYHDRDQCAAAEAAEKERQLSWQNQHDAATKLDRLKAELDQAMAIYPGTICTCSFNSLQVKALIGVCQRFAEQNKEFLAHY